MSTDLTVLQPTEGTLKIAGAVIAGTLVDGVFAPLTGGGNATVPNDASVQPPQSFVDSYAVYINSIIQSMGVGIDFTGLGITYISSSFVAATIQIQAAIPADIYAVLANNALTSEVIDVILNDVDTTAINGGFLDISGGTNAAPTGGAANANIISLLLKGWTINYNT